MNKLVYLGISMLELSKILMYEFWCNYIKSKSDEKAKLCYVDKKEKGTKMCLIKTKLEFENYKRCLKATHIGIK